MATDATTRVRAVPVPAPARLGGLRELRVPLLFLLPSFLLILVFFITPVVNTILISLTDLSTATFRDPSWVGFGNYVSILQNRWTPLIFQNTLFYVAVTLCFNVGMGLVIAITSSFLPDRMGDSFRALWLLPRITSPVVYVVIWQGLLAPGPFGFLSALTGVSQNWLNAFPWHAVILANGIIGASFGMLIFTAAIRSIPQDLFHASAVDGASRWQVVRYVILPQLHWPIMFVTAYQSLSLLSSFEYILLLTRGGPGFYTTEVWSLWAYNEAFESYVGNARFGLGAAMATALVLIGIVVSLSLLRLFRFGDLVARPKIEVN
jgi:inositol-phosphate transport system permease protein